MKIAGELDYVDSIVVDDAYAAFTLSNIGQNFPLRRALHAIKLDTGADSILVADEVKVGPMSAPIALIQGNAYYTIPSILPQDGSGPRQVMRVPLTGGARNVPFQLEPTKEYDLVSASPDGTLFGAWKAGDVSPPVSLHGAWSWRVGVAAPFLHYPSESVREIDAFNGGAAMLSASGENVYLHLNMRLETPIRYTAANGRIIRHVRSKLEGSSPMVSVYTLEGSPISNSGLHQEQIIKDPCVTDVQSGVIACPEGENLIQYSVGAGSDLVDFQVRDDNSIVVSQLDTTGFRPATRLLLVGGGKLETIGGEGVTGTIDTITALATRGNCIYWAERGTTAIGSRIMRVAR